MPKHNLLSKKLKKHFLSTNELIESYFNKFSQLINDFKKSKLSANSRIILVIGTVVILTLSYFLIPTFYDENIIKKKIKNQVLKKYNIELNINDDLNYLIFPKPHFVSKDSSIVSRKKNIADIKNLKIFISLNDFFSINDVNVKDLIFQKTDFNIFKEDVIFFYKLLKTKPNTNKLLIKDSKIFFKDKEEEVLFINKIYNSSFFYDSKNLENVLTSKNEIFNIPYKLNVKKNEFNKNLFFEFNSKKIRLNIENEINFDKIIDGLLDLSFINKSTSLSYKIKNNFLTFESENKKNNYDGIINFKPFYLDTNLNFHGLSTKNLFDDDSILIDVLKTDILKNKNLNANIDLDIKNITNIDELNRLFLKISIEEGNIDLSNSNIMWKDDLQIKFKDSYLIYDEKGINILGKVIIDFKNVNDFYKSFQIQKNYRKEINKVELDFIYNFSEKKIIFDNVKIDNETNVSLDKYINDLKSEIKISNKIIIKNFINDFFKAYSG